MRRDDLFYCYSINLLRELRKDDHDHIAKGTNSNTNKDYWVFIKTPSFLETLTRFTNAKVN
jgi:hypothetical protein